MNPVGSGSAIIRLTNNKPVYVSATDLGVISGYSWRPLPSGKTVYARADINGRQVLMHRLILSVDDDVLVDHRDGNGLNNTRDNLRACSQQQNRWNVRTKAISGFCGVTRSGGRWMAKWVSNGVHQYAGCWPTAIEAALAYNDAVRAQRGDFAVINTVPAMEARELLERRLADLAIDAARIERWLKEIS